MAEFPNYFTSVSSNFEKELITFESESKLRFLQVGVYTGDASEWILNRFSYVSDFILTDVDTWSSGDSKEMSDLDFRRIEDLYLQRTYNERNLGRCQSNKTTSDKFFAENNEMYNFIYIDGNHEPIQVLKDGLNGFECLVDEGILAFDDYLGAQEKPQNDRPKIAIDLFLELLGAKVEVVVDNYQLWIKKVPLSRR
jgi:hypothetical protein